MSSRLGPIEICCDAPSYAVVRASRWLGLASPEDVRWLRVSHFLQSDAAPFDAHAWTLYVEMGGARRRRCSCGNDLPILERCTFTFRDGRQRDYLLGQCGRCQTVFWEEA